MKVRENRDAFLEGTRKRAKAIVGWYGLDPKVAHELTEYLVTMAMVGWDAGYKSAHVGKQTGLPF